jgi:hypothetical protein
MKKTLVCLLVPVLLLAVGVSSAAALSMPQAADPTVVIPTSIGGVSLNMPEAKAKKAWGNGRGKCVSNPEISGCEYGSMEAGRANIGFVNGKVTSAYVYGIETNGVKKTTAAGALLKFKTSGGVGIGSTFSALQKAFPKGKVEGDPKSDYFKFEAKGKGNARMAFLVVNGKIWSFGIDAVAHT